ncbi:queuine trna-ribosyltransferase [Plasmopara halstedii]|uniref:Queuine tRNA-ribosyltransferase catalytic subunit 1 n=1 Tax=Plasmopara halstedii TaxID=4781 RepID=A0A0P1AAA9_PLAHL|nr:queuine trna-ribosyltransferase [Plasmopara halstedii]CEG37798.1 queuine trna-ribosyltransferase [Plasmopara halstedii]|eukprot:XP_024574167.1 queuine trna-ribosyltransferase [Plasmopara halstedii]
MSNALSFNVVGRYHRARAATLMLPHGEVNTPVFMPVGTQGAMKGLTTLQMEEEPINCQIFLSNTYHLALRPGTDVLAQLPGKLHEFMQWPRNLLTDSGGFQMVSLSKLCEVSEHGVKFESFVDGSTMILTPEASIAHQNRIGADIIMALDDVVSSVEDDENRFHEACDRTVRWLDRCIKAHAYPEKQNLFGIVQGGLDVTPGGLRDQCLKQLIQRNLPGYAIGGLAGGESKDAFWRVVAKCTAQLPVNKPRYLMGVGYPVDLVVCSALGVDMFDCVYPTRTARFGTAIVPSGLLKLKQAKWEDDDRPIDDTCKCFVCKTYTRAYLRVLLKTGDISDTSSGSIGAHLITYHNVTYMLNLMRQLRQSIIDQTFEQFVQKFMLQHYPDRVYPQWVIDALTEAKIRLQ